MLIMAVHQTPSLTQERYEEVVRRLTNGKRRLESTSDLPFDGLAGNMAPTESRTSYRPYKIDGDDTGAATSAIRGRGRVNFAPFWRNPSLPSWHGVAA